MGVDKFKKQYYDLLKAVTEGNEEEIRNICEKRLADEFISSLAWIRPQVEEIKFVGEDNLNVNDLLDIELVDFMEYSGAYIDRQKNIEAGCKPIGFGPRRPNFKGFL